MVMYCWKCGQELTDGASACVYCGADQRRPEPTSEAGRAMRQLYDRYGRDAVLTNNLMLVNGLGDLVENSQKLRNQMKMALDAGVGRLYLDQLNGTGAPDAAFDQRVRALMSDEAGLNDKAIYEITDCFDDMIGWRAASEARPASKAQPQPAAETHEETDRATGKAYRKPEPTPAPQPEPPKNGEGGRIVAVIIALLVLLGGGFLAYKHVMGPDVTGTWYLNAVTKGATTSDPADDGRYAALTLNKDGSAEYVTKVYGKSETQSGSWKNNFGTLTLELEGADSLMKAEGDTLSFRDAEGSQLAFGRDITVAPTPTPKPTIKPSPTPKPTVKPSPTPVLNSVTWNGATLRFTFDSKGIESKYWWIKGYIGTVEAYAMWFEESSDEVGGKGNEWVVNIGNFALIPGMTYRWQVGTGGIDEASNIIEAAVPLNSSGYTKLEYASIGNIKKSELVDLVHELDQLCDDSDWDRDINDVFSATIRLSNPKSTSKYDVNDLRVMITWPYGKKIDAGSVYDVDEYGIDSDISKDIVNCIWFVWRGDDSTIETGTYKVDFYDWNEKTYLGSTTFTVTQG